MAGTADDVAHPQLGHHCGTDPRIGDRTGPAPVRGHSPSRDPGPAAGVCHPGQLPCPPRGDRQAIDHHRGPHGTPGGVLPQGRRFRQRCR
ncbi:hypothetical protein ACFFX0_20520 [Citricoccus parietis]|uniref:Uncharacterized protein n=1 Tax=Citricoccus parietis TaxID=592307 RepID=A0ABV5G3D9_9MICC